jgi:glucokinase
MIIAVDIGGTKTHVAFFGDSGEIEKESRFKTPPEYNDFLAELSTHIIHDGAAQPIEAIGLAVPGSIEQESGKILALGNLSWENKPIVGDIGQLLKIDKVYLENDANLAALAEARAMPKAAPLLLYITLSTGIGSGIIVNNQLLTELSGSEAGQMMVRNAAGEQHRWETFASGRALVRLTGKEAAELKDSALWQEYTMLVCMGLQPAISVLRPQVVVIGGGVGAHLESFQEELEKQLSELNHSRTYTDPVIQPAHFGEKSVVYGCYEYAKDHLA